MKSQKTLYRQGDVLFIPISTIPSQSIPKKDKIVAYGEVTGHMHQFETTALVQCYLNDQTQYIDVASPSIIIHDEHLPIEIPQGKYEIRIGRELDLMQQIRQVQD